VARKTARSTRSWVKVSDYNLSPLTKYTHHLF
jgi:hypothetical protein